MFTLFVCGMQRIRKHTKVKCALTERLEPTFVAWWSHFSPTTRSFPPAGVAPWVDSERMFAEGAAVAPGGPSESPRTSSHAGPQPTAPDRFPRPPGPSHRSEKEPKRRTRNPDRLQWHVQAARVPWIVVEAALVVNGG